MRTCTEDGCEKRHHAKGYCATHLARIRRNGTTAPTRLRDSTTRVYTAEERLRARTVVEERGYGTPCWIYQGSPGRIRADGQAYAGLRWKGSMIPAHLVAFRELVRELGENEQVHHRCGTKPCWRPDHLVALDPVQHSREHRGQHSPDGTCLDALCDRRDLVGWGYCRKHYLRLWKLGAFTA